MVTTKLNLSMTEPQVRQIYAKQGDTGRVLDITLDQTPEDGTLRILRPDGTEVTSEAVTGGEVSESGETVTFESMTEADVTELTVGIEPVQDLNGYDAPWVGGAGVNIIGNFGLRANPLSNNVSATLQADGSSYVLSGTASALADIYLFSASSSNIDVGSYYLYAPTGLNLAGTTADYFYIGIRGSSGTRYVGVGGTVTSRAFTIAEGEYLDRAFIRISSGVDATGKVVTPMIVKGTTAPTSYSPYSNICPITGHDEVTVTRTGINLWDEEWEVGNITTIGTNGTSTDRIRSKEYISVLPSTSYYRVTPNNIQPFYYDPNKTFLSYGTWGKGVITTPSKAYYVRFQVDPVYGTTYNNDASINYPSTDHDYHAYQGSTYTTSLGQTVYGGTLDLVSGVLTVDRAMVDLGSLTWLLNSSLNGKPAFYVRLDDAKTVSASSVADMTTSCYSVISADNLYIQKDNTGIIALNGQNYLQVRDTRYSTASAYKSGITGQTLVYELATPQTYTLTAQQIKTLVGTNNVWASSGDIVSITFTYGGLLSELPSEATEIVGKCYCDVEQNGVSSMPFTLNVKKNERES